MKLLRNALFGVPLAYFAMSENAQAQGSGGIEIGSKEKNVTLPSDAGPQIPYWSQWTDSFGQTHTSRCLLLGLASEAYSSTPQFVHRLPGAVEAIVFTQLPVAWFGNWHVTPKPQWVIMLSGTYYMETSDGSNATLKAGDVFLGSDRGAKGSQTDPNRVGHISRVVGKEPVNQMIIRLQSEPAAGRADMACPY